jgi:alcohol dehydrogenase YqhD (iron-dependent ADH family)
MIILDNQYTEATMNNFEFLVPTKIIFGKGTESRTGALVKPYASKILLHYGTGSIKKSGLYDRIVTSLKEAGVAFTELGGVQPNPRLSLVREGIKICRDQKIGFILAVGGGSVIDSAKAIGVGAPYDGDVWDFFTGKGSPESMLPVATVLTIPAAGSEASPSSVITNEEGWLKRGLTNEHLRPVFSILNPELTFTLPDYQTACGTADIMAHIMERYFTHTKGVDLTDRLCEAGLKTLINTVPRVLKERDNYDIRADILWTGCVAHNDLFGTGRDQDWASHDIEHELSGIYDVAHGAGLAVVFPAWMKYVYKENIDRFVQFAIRVWDVDQSFDSREAIALEGIRRITRFFKEIGLPTTLKELEIPPDRLEEMADKATGKGSWTIGGFKKLGRNDVLEILKLAL